MSEKNRKKFTWELNHMRIEREENLIRFYVTLPHLKSTIYFIEICPFQKQTQVSGLLYENHFEDFVKFDRILLSNKDYII